MKEKTKEDLFKKEKRPLYYVGIGASAGGLEALELFFKHIPPNTDLAFIVVQHLSPDYKSLMNELLARHTKMPIQIIESGITAEPNNIYLIPPRTNLSIYHGKLYLEEQNAHQKLNLPIDVFFRSLAIDQERKAIGIILSGTGSDGAIGVRAIKESGGIILVQDERSAKFDGMPQSAIATGIVDAILPAEKMADFLKDYIAHPFNLGKDKELPTELDSLSKILMILRDSSGVDFSYYKESTIVRRIERRIQINRFATLEEYVPYLNESQKEKDTLYRELLIGVTSFFRDQEAFKHLKDKVLPKLNYRKENIRVWSAACSTGEEVYSLAILFKEYLEQNHLNCEVKIFATDLDRIALDTAGKGFYPDGIMADIDPKYLTKYFNKREHGYEVKESIRNMVVFARHNILKDPPFSRLDLLVCRNLFIYFKPDLQQRILSTFYYALNQGGFLFMGSSESIGEMSEGFNVIDSKWKIYQQKDGLKTDIFKGLSLQKNFKPLETQVGDNKSLSLGKFRIEHLLMSALSKSVTPSVILDENYQIIEIINDMSPYIKIQPGRFSSNIFSNLPNELALFVNNILRRLKAGSEEVVFERIKGIEGFEEKVLRLKGQFLDVHKVRYYFLSFDFEVISTENKAIERHTIVDIEHEINERVKQLEHELLISKESLQAIVEELETSNEELQSSNEELIASNEELQSTNEELQSVNEELYSVNSEHQMKIEELVRLNNDLSNLLKNTEIGALYLDKKLCIRKTNQKVSEITNIMDSDIGRPISHIKVMEKYPNFIDDINQVVETLKGVDKEYTDTKGKTWLTRIRPYRSEYNAVDGIIVTFVEITRLKEKEIRLSQIYARLDSAMHFGNIAWWEWDLTTGKVIFDEKKATMLGYRVEEFPTDVYAICDLIHPDDYDRTMSIMRDHLEGRTDSWSASYRIKRKDGKYGWYHDRGKITQKNAHGEPILIVGTVIDITSIKEMEAEILEHRQMVDDIIDATPTGMIHLSSSGEHVYSNSKALEILGQPGQISTIDDWALIDESGNTISKSKHPFYSIERKMSALSYKTFFYSNPKDGQIKIAISGIPLKTREGKFNGVLLFVDKL